MDVNECPLMAESRRSLTVNMQAVPEHAHMTWVGINQRGVAR